MRRKRSSDACDLDMTPMIDVVFQMIIFFIVTIKMDETKNEEIVLEDARESPLYEGKDPRTIVIEVDKRGWLYMSNTPLTQKQLRGIIKRRYKMMGAFPVMIRADRETLHKDVKKVMDICSENGIWKIDFAAIKEHKKHG
jgi:biopolymer transport protein ExbD